MLNKEEIVMQLYPAAIWVSNTADGGFLAKDESGNFITVDKDAVNTEYAKQEYKNKRRYPSIQEQLDMQFWDKKNGTTTWVDAVAKVKSDNPKP